MRQGTGEEGGDTSKPDCRPAPAVTQRVSLDSPPSMLSLYSAVTLQVGHERETSLDLRQDARENLGAHAQGRSDDAHLL